MRPARINRIANIFGAKTYLEIGVFDGATFFDVSVPHKVAVDPNFLFDYRAKANRHTVFHPVASDEFFRTAAPQKFDIIYLDGLHTFEQTLRDFINSCSFSHARTIWLIDDTTPNDNFSALADQERCYRLRRMLNNPDWAWMGDVFKTVYFIRNAMPFYNFRTFTGHGQTVVWRDDAVYNQRESIPLEKVGAMTYEDFVETHQSMLNFAPDESIFEDLTKFSKKRV